MKHVALVEPNLCGHHAMYLKCFTKVLLAFNCKLTIVSRDVQEAKSIISDEREDITYKTISYKYAVNKNYKGLRKKFFVCVNLLRTIYNLFVLKRQVHGVELVFFCTVDDFLNDLMPPGLFDYLLPYKWAGLYLQANQSGGIRLIDKRNLFRNKNCEAVAVLGKASDQLLNCVKNKIIYFPDFTETSLPDYEYKLVVEIRERAKGRKIISLIGAMASRKGIKTFVNVASMVDEDQYFFVLAGEGAETSITKEEEELINLHFKDKSNCFYYPKKIISDKDFNALINNTDILYAAYIDFEYSSNMFAKASFFRKPLIVSKGYYMEEVINKFRIGLAIEQNNTVQCRDAILYLSSDDFSREMRPDFDLCFQENSSEKLYAAFSCLINKC